MSNGYLVAAPADAAAAREIGDGFGLDVIGIDTIADADSVIAALANAANVGLVLSNAAANDVRFVSLMHALAARLGRAQLISVEADARAQFGYLPAAWPEMSLDEARNRAAALVRQRTPQPEAPPPAPPAPPPVEQDASAEAPEPPAAEPEPAPQTEAPAQDEGALLGGVGETPREEEAAPPISDSVNEQEREDDFGAGAPTIQEDAAPAPAAPPAEEPPAPPPQAAEPAPEPEPAPPPQAAAPEAPPAPAPPSADQDVERGITLPPKRSAPSAAPGAVSAPSAPADATAFAPKKLRRGTPELVRIVVHQPKDLNAVIKAAKKLDPRTDAAPQGMPLGDVALGASIGVSLEVRGAQCDGAVQRRAWQGEPIDFSFSAEADESVKQVVFLARVFINDAQIGVLAFTRNVTGPNKKPHSDGDRVRLKRHKRVFLSYSSKDRETVSAIATAYASAGVEHFWDRASLKSGEEWHPRLRREIDRADLFHVCWSKNAAQSEWVKKETEHAITRRRRNSGKPDITVQMLDGPPWAPHPPELDSINFDDFVRAAIVGYARGDGET